jgi:predicted neutral ceramidase superfamily lipid hydrolase
MELSKEEKLLKVVLGIFAVAFLITDIVLVFATPTLFNSINAVAERIGAGKTPLPNQNFYLALTNALMLMIVYMSYMVWKDVKKNLNMVPALIICKFVSSVTGLLFFIFSARYFAYLVVTITDFPIFLVLYILYRRVRGAKPPQS